MLKDLVVDMEPFFDAYRSVMPFLVTSGNEPTRERIQTPGRPGPLRRHHQVHPVRRVHHLVPGLLERRAVLRPAGDRRRAPVHLRQPRRGHRPAPGDPQRQGGRVALPHHLQLHRGLPAGHRGHQGDPGSEAGADLPPLSRSAGLEVAGPDVDTWCVGAGTGHFHVAGTGSATLRPRGCGGRCWRSGRWRSRPTRRTARAGPPRWGPPGGPAARGPAWTPRGPGSPAAPSVASAR